MLPLSAPSVTKPAVVTVALSPASGAATRYTWTSGPFEVSKPVRRSTRWPSGWRKMVAVPVVLWATLWKLPLATGTGAAWFMAEPAVLLGSFSLTVWLTHSRSGRNRYQPPPTTSTTTVAMMMFFGMFGPPGGG